MSNGWQDVPAVSPAQLKQLIDTGESLDIIDVREHQEWNVSNLGNHGARHIPMAELPGRLDEIPRDAHVVVYCRSGARSERVVRYLLAQGYERVSNLDGGINDWARDVDPDLPLY